MPTLKESLAASKELAEGPTLGNMHPDARAQAIARASALHGGKSDGEQPGASLARWRCIDPPNLGPTFQRDPNGPWVLYSDVAAPAANGGWIAVDERLPPEADDNGSLLVLVYTPARDGDIDRFDFDWIYEGGWHNHNDNHDHYMAVTGGKGCLDDDTPCIGPSEKAPYTHWMPLPAPPAIAAAPPTVQQGEQK